MVGDRFHDREVALRNDIPFVACAYGFGEPGECEGADAIAECAEELPNQFHARFFRKLTKQTITKNQFKGVLFDTPLFFHPFGKQEKRAFLTNF